MAKKWNDYTKREKAIGIIGAFCGVFVISSMANSASNPSSNSTTGTTPTTQQSQVQPTTTKEISENIVIPFEKTRTESSQYEKGSTQITTAGVNGEKTVTYRVSLTNGTESSREIINEIIIKEPVTEVTSIGTYVKPAAAQKQASTCDPNYSGACVPIASDVDCAGGSGNGPAYVRGPVYVIGSDIYHLDRNHDGVGCE
jgi:hypothetical protein